MFTSQIDNYYVGQFVSWNKVQIYYPVILAIPNWLVQIDLVVSFMLIIFEYFNKKIMNYIVFQLSTSFTFNPSFLLHVDTWTSILMYKKSEVLVRMRVVPTHHICGLLQVSTISKIEGKLIFTLSSKNTIYN